MTFPPVATEGEIEKLATEISVAGILSPVLLSTQDAVNRLLTRAENIRADIHNIKETVSNYLPTNQRGSQIIFSSDQGIAVNKNLVNDLSSRLDNLVTDIDKHADTHAALEEVVKPLTILKGQPRATNGHFLLSPEHNEEILSKCEKRRLLIRDSLLWCLQDLENFYILPTVIGFITPPIELEGIRLGKFLVEINRNAINLAETFNRKIRIKAITPNYSCSDNGHTHPHADIDGDVCVGNGDVRLVRSANVGNIYQLCENIVSLIGHYNKDSPYSYLKHWRMQELCALCSTPTHDKGNPTENSKKCNKCGCYTCSNHKIKCGCCEQLKCNKITTQEHRYKIRNCVNKCHSCEQIVCHECITKTAYISSRTDVKFYCRNCIVECPQCHNMRSKKRMLKKGICRACSAENQQKLLAESQVDLTPNLDNIDAEITPEDTQELTPAFEIPF